MRAWEILLGFLYPEIAIGVIIGKVLLTAIRLVYFTLQYTIKALIYFIGRL